jgi:hypothetical protein
MAFAGFGFGLFQTSNNRSMIAAERFQIVSVRQ